MKGTANTMERAEHSYRVFFTDGGYVDITAPNRIAASRDAIEDRRIGSGGKPVNLSVANVKREGERGFSKNNA